MNITPFTIYLISLADGFSQFLLIIGILFLAFCILCACVSSEHDFKILRKTMIFTGVFSILLFISSAIMPSTKTLIAMYAIPAITNIQDIQKLPTNFVTFINKYLSESVNEKHGE